MRASLLFNALAGIAVLAVLLFGSPDAPPTFRLVDASGALVLSNSREGAALLSGDRLRPGARSTGSVTLGNPSGTDAALALEVTSEGERAGAGGARLWSRLRLSVSDGSRVLYDGPVAGMGRLALGALPAGARRTLAIAATLPRGANDNALQGARLSVRFTWLAQPEATATPTPEPPTAEAPPIAAPPTPPATLTARALISLPPAKRCVRSIRVRTTPPRGITVTALAATVNGHRRAAGRTAVTLRHLPPGRFRVKATATLATGTKLARTRTYHACG